MSTRFWKIFLAMFLVGFLLAASGFENARMFINKKKINLNTATIKDFEDECLVEGEIAYVTGQFATYETKDKVLGITTSKHTSNYYLVENVSMEELKRYIEEPDYEFENYFCYVVSASTPEMKSKLNVNSTAWELFINGTTDKYPEPVQFEGKLWKQPKDKKYEKLKDDAVKEIGIDKSELAVLQVCDNTPDIMSLILFIGGVLLAVIGLAVMIAAIVSSRKRKKAVLSANWD